MNRAFKKAKVQIKLINKRNIDFLDTMTISFNQEIKEKDSSYNALNRKNQEEIFLNKECKMRLKIVEGQLENIQRFLDSHIAAMPPQNIHVEKICENYRIRKTKRLNDFTIGRIKNSFELKMINIDDTTHLLQSLSGGIDTTLIDSFNAQVHAYLVTPSGEAVLAVSKDRFMNMSFEELKDFIAYEMATHIVKTRHDAIQNKRHY